MIFTWFGGDWKQARGDAFMVVWEEMEGKQRPSDEASGRQRLVMAHIASWKEVRKEGSSHTKTTMAVGFAELTCV